MRVSSDGKRSRWSRLTVGGCGTKWLLCSGSDPHTSSPRSLRICLRACVSQQTLAPTTNIDTMSQQGVQSALGNIPRVVVQPTVDNVIASTYLVKVLEVILALLAHMLTGNRASSSSSRTRSCTLCSRHDYSQQSSSASSCSRTSSSGRCCHRSSSSSCSTQRVVPGSTLYSWS